MLGYGALGRETARLLKSHGMKVIAANTSGKATTQDGVSHLPPDITQKRNVTLVVEDRADGST